MTAMSPSVRPYKKWKVTLARWVASRRTPWTTAQAARAVGASDAAARHQMIRLANIGRIKRDGDGNWNLNGRPHKERPHA